MDLMESDFFYFAIIIGSIVVIISVLAALAFIVFPSGLQECGSGDALGFLCITLPCTFPLVIAVAVASAPCLFVFFAHRIHQQYLTAQKERRELYRCYEGKRTFPNHFRYSLVPLSPMSHYSTVKPVIMKPPTSKGKAKEELNRKPESTLVEIVVRHQQHSPAQSVCL